MSYEEEALAGALPPAVLTLEALQEVVDAIREEGAFCFDVETRGNISRHPDVLNMIDDEWVLKKQSLKSTNVDVLARSRKAIEDSWTGDLALDPLRNEVTWIGIAVSGMSWAIPLSHRNGEMLTPPERGDGTTVPPPGHRAILKSGNESMAKAKYFIPGTFTEPPKQLDASVVWNALAPLFLDEEIPKVGHNIKFDARSVAKYIGDIPRGMLVDTMTLMHVVNENLRAYSLENVIHNQFKNWDPYHRDGKLGAVMDTVPFSKACYYVHLDVRWTWTLYKRLFRIISKYPTLLGVAHEDINCTRPLARAEQNGILVNKRQMGVLGKEIAIEMNQILMDMAQYVPIGFSPDSNVHKAQYLFGKKSDGGLGFKPVKFTPGGKASVDDKVLEALRGKHPMVDLLVKWAELGKLKSTYVEGLLPKLHNGRLHPRFHLHRTQTGRLSASDPNLQNIPRDGKVRSLFIAEPGNSLLVADYDQIELRIMASLSGDKNMHYIFTNGIDVHTGTAALILGKKPEDVTSDERQVYGKTPNFLMGYGGGPKKLVDSTKGAITFDQAKQIVDDYNKAYSGMTAWKKEVVIQGKKKGYVETLGGRRRRLPDLNIAGWSDESRMARQRAERQAVNAVVQGTASEICKRAITQVDKVIDFPKCKLLVQVHDELVLSVPTDELRVWEPKLLVAMGDGDIMNGGIPLRVSSGYAGSWYDAKAA